MAGTTVEPFPGRMLTTLGLEFGGVAAVVNWLLKFTSAFPLRSVIPGDETTVIVDDAGKVVVNVAVRLSADSEGFAPKYVSPLYNPSVFALTVAGFTECENVMDTTAFCPTPVAPFAGVTEVTVKGVTTGDVTGV